MSAISLHSVSVTLGGKCVVDDRKQVDILALAVRDIRGQDELRAARPDPVAKGAGAETSEHDAVDGADPNRRKHRDDRLGRGGHVDRDAVTLADAETAEAGRHSFDLVEQLPIGQ